MESNKDLKVYEIGYLLVSSIPEEKIEAKYEALKDFLSKKGVEHIGEEKPELIDLSYTMIKKVDSRNVRFTQGYFGWFKFAIDTETILEIKKAFDVDLDVLRYLLINTPRENTYLGKRASAILKEEPIEAIVKEDIKEEEITKIDEIAKVDEVTKEE